MRTSELETITQDSVPSPRQLDLLVSKVLLFSQRHGKLRIKNNEPEKYQKRFLANPSVRYERPDILSGARVGSINQYALGAIATLHASGTWSLRLYRAFEVRSVLEDSPGGVRENFSFKWNSDSTKLARRETKFIPSGDTMGIDDMIDSFSIRDDAAAILEASDELLYVSGADVHLLLKDLNNDQSLVDSNEVPYSDRRKNYFDYST